MALNSKVDYIIVGQGLGGSVLAWELMRRGWRVCVIDNGHLDSASVVAAGIINPVIGKRWVVAENFGVHYEAAKAFYREVEKALGVHVFQERGVLRLFVDGAERERCVERLDALSPYARWFFGDNSFGQLRDGFGSMAVGPAATVDTRVLLLAFKKYFKAAGVLRVEAFSHDDCDVSGAGVGSGIGYRGVRAKNMIFCEGYRGMDNPYFKDLPFNPAKGEILEIELDAELPNYIINQGKWLVSLGERRYRVGATYSWGDLNNTPTVGGRDEILDAIRGMLVGCNILRVIHHEAAVRPTTKDTKPLILQHVEFPGLHFFNGFGSKGALMIPFYAKAFADRIRSEI